MVMPKRNVHLSDIDINNYDLTRALMSLLNSGDDVVPALRTSAHAALHPEAGLIISQDGIAFQLLDSGGSPLVRDKEDVEAVCDALDRADPVLLAIERQLQINLDAQNIQKPSMAADKAIVLSVATDAVIVQLVFELSDARADEWIMRAAAHPIRREDISCCLHVELSGPKLTVSDVEAMNVGDLLLLPDRVQANLQAELSETDLPTRERQYGLYHMKTGQFVLSLQDMPGEQPRDSAIEDDVNSVFPGLQVPISIRIPNSYIDAATLSEQQVTGALHCVPVFQGMRVHVLVGGKDLACGSMVSIGDSFAVDIEERINDLTNTPLTGGHIIASSTHEERS